MIMEFLDKALNFLLSAEGSAATIAVVFEFVLRLVPSQKPLSVMYIIAKVVSKVGEILVFIGKLLDKILPQKLK
jgi:hypothetical protein